MGIVNLTGHHAAFNLAGPAARAVLRAHTALDLSEAAFAYLALREGLIAGAPCRMLRVESCLLFYPYDMSQRYPCAHDPPGDSLWELGLDFTVSPGKTDFRGAEQHYRLKGKERLKIFGVRVDGDEPTDLGDAVYADGKQVGVVTCGMYSSLTKQSMALARLDLPAAARD